VRVVDCSTVGPAARCTRILADYGASVVKVAPVPGRGVEPIVPPVHAYAAQRYWRRVHLDLRHPDGRDALLAMARVSDVVVESFRPGVLDRLRLGYDVLSAANPGLVLCSTSGYGQDGPRAGAAGHDIDYLAVGGYLWATEPRGDGGPPLPGVTVADAAAGGMHAALAVMAALLERGRGGGGTHLDVSVADGVLWLTSLAVDEHLATGAPAGFGSGVTSGRYACYACYEAADGAWLAVGAIEPRFFAALCRVLRCEQWTAHQLDDDVQAAMRADFARAFATRGRAEWLACFDAEDACVAPVQSAAEVAADPQFAARGAFVEAVVAGAPEHTFRQVAPVLAGMVRPHGPVVVPDPATSDAVEVLGEAGLDAARVAELCRDGAVA
jgi:alpha-methylacyl-CoA racemase